MSSQSFDYFVTVINQAKNLTKKEKDILVSRLHKIPLKKIGRRYKLSYERIRQIEKEALDRLRNQKISQLLLFD